MARVVDAGARQDGARRVACLEKLCYGALFVLLSPFLVLMYSHAFLHLLAEKETKKKKIRGGVMANSTSQGPLTEELLFRSAAIPLMILARTPLTKTIFLSPLVFGLAHVHHLYEFRVTHRNVPMSAAVLRSAFQLGYTTLFGAYATFLYLRTGSLLAVFAVHVLCNCMGLPRVWGKVTGIERRVVRPGSGEQKEEVVEVEVEVAKGWTVGYYVLLVVGAGLWYRGLWPLTENGNALVDFGW